MKPEFVKVGDKKYKIFTDFRVALKCDEIIRDISIGDYERTLAIIYKLFGDNGLNDKNKRGKLRELALKYLSRGEEPEVSNEAKEPNMDFKQDMSYIYASFMSEYQIDLYEKEMHYYTFLDLLNGLSEDCVLNRIRYIRDFDINEVDDVKERKRIMELKKSVALKQDKEKLTEEEKEKMESFLEKAKLK